MNAKSENISIVRVVPLAQDSPPRRSEIICAIGRDVEIDYRSLENFCFQLISNHEYELSLLAGVIAFADRSIRRNLSSGWARRINLHFPVADPVFWNRAKDLLKDALDFLTGDFWEIEFERRKLNLGKVNQDILNLGSGRFIVIPFSNGLDSYAQSQLLKLQPEYSPIRITSRNRGITGSPDWIFEPDGSRHRRVSIAVKCRSDAHPEATFRSRMFVFCVFAGIAAHLSKAEAILVPENGQGALGPSLVPVGAESPQRGSHPGFTRRMSNFFRQFWQEDIVFRHPQLWLTKGEVLKKLKAENLLGQWEMTRSCPRDQRNVNLNHRWIQCGVCSGCLLRRMSVFAAGLNDNPDSYLWPNLSAYSLETSMQLSAGRKTTNNDSDIAHHAVIAMAELAMKADAAPNDPNILQSAFEICAGGGRDLQATVDKLRSLLKNHQFEWQEFVKNCGSLSWIGLAVKDL